MTNPPCLQVTFIPVPKSTPIAELYALIGKCQARETEIIQQEKDRRRRFAAKMRALKKRITGQTTLKSQKKQSGIFKKIMRGLRNQSKTIINNCYKDSLNTIKNVCLSVSTESTECCNQLLEQRLKAVFESLEFSPQNKLEIPPSFVPEQNNFPADSVIINSELKNAQARIKMDCGDILIDVTADLAAGFDRLEEKLNQQLRSGDYR